MLVPNSAVTLLALATAPSLGALAPVARPVVQIRSPRFLAPAVRMQLGGELHPGDQDHHVFGEGGTQGDYAQQLRGMNERGALLRAKLEDDPRGRAILTHEIPWEKIPGKEEPWASVFGKFWRTTRGGFPWLRRSLGMQGREKVHLGELIEYGVPLETVVTLASNLGVIGEEEGVLLRSLEEGEDLLEEGASRPDSPVPTKNPRRAALLGMQVFWTQVPVEGEPWHSLFGSFSKPTEDGTHPWLRRMFGVQSNERVTLKELTQYGIPFENVFAFAKQIGLLQADAELSAFAEKKEECIVDADSFGEQEAPREDPMEAVRNARPMRIAAKQREEKQREKTTSEEGVPEQA